MLQQTQVKTVVPYWERWMQSFPTIAALAAASEEQVLKLWEGLGYYRRARNLHRAAQLLVERNSGEFPSDHDAILDLPGIGRYTAGAIGSIAFNRNVPILDGNVARVLSRLTLQNDQAMLWEAATALVESTAQPSALNQGLMELGALICTPRDPRCPECPLRTDCRALREDLIAHYPKPAARKAPRERRFIAVVLRNRDSVLVRKREANVVNGGLWEFPNFELLPGEKAETRLTDWVAQPRRLTELCTIRHTITDNRITLQALTGSARGKKPAFRLRSEWRPLGEIQSLPFSSAHGKIRKLLLAKAFQMKPGLEPLWVP